MKRKSRGGKMRRFVLYVLLAALAACGPYTRKLVWDAVPVRVLAKEKVERPLFNGAVWGRITGKDSTERDNRVGFSPLKSCQITILVDNSVQTTILAPGDACEKLQPNDSIRVWRTITWRVNESGVPGPEHREYQWIKK